MADELSQLLMQSSRHASISPEALELMGKKAANMYLDQNIALNEGVAKLAGEHEDINSEQVKRICEFANTATYLAMHDKSKTAGAGSSYPQFILADPARVIQDLSDGARPTMVTPIDADYGRQPEKKKVSFVSNEKVLADLFGHKEAAAREDLPYTKDSIYRDISAQRDMLTGMKDNLSNSASQLDSIFKTAADEFYEVTKRHVLGGGEFADVLNAVRWSGASSEKISSVMKPVVAQLIKEKVASPEKLAQSVSQMSKLAHREVNTDHPLVKSFKAIIDTDQEIHKVAASLADIDLQLGRVHSFLRENFGASSPR